jgi:hypothetical protein
MLLNIVIDASEVSLVDHAEFDFLARSGNDEVESVAQDIGVGYRVYGGEVQVGQGLFEAIEYTDRGEEQVA